MTKLALFVKSYETIDQLTHFVHLILLTSACLTRPQSMKGTFENKH